MSLPLSSVFKALRAALARIGVHVGGTAAYPRIEIHSLVQSEPLEKSSSIFRIDCIVESVSDVKVADVIELAEGNEARIYEAAGIDPAGYTIIGYGRGQVRLFEEQETTEQNKVIYRLLQDMSIWVEKNNQTI